MTEAETRANLLFHEMAIRALILKVANLTPDGPRFCEGLFEDIVQLIRPGAEHGIPADKPVAKRALSICRGMEAAVAHYFLMRSGKKPS